MRFAHFADNQQLETEKEKKKKAHISKGRVIFNDSLFY
jgi:hypothetical protein